MSSYQDIQVCVNCHEEHWIEYDLRSGEVTSVSQCLCMRRIAHKDNLIANYAQFSAGLQQDITEVVELIEAFSEGILSSPEKTLEEVARDLRDKMSGWQALDTWTIEPEDDDDDE